MRLDRDLLLVSALLVAILVLAYVLGPEHGNHHVTCGNCHQ